jgi:hypothetical protein
MPAKAKVLFISLIKQTQTQTANKQHPEHKESEIYSFDYLAATALS